MQIVETVCKLTTEDTSRGETYKVSYQRLVNIDICRYVETIHITKDTSRGETYKFSRQRLVPIDIQKQLPDI